MRVEAESAHLPGWNALTYSGPGLACCDSYVRARDVSRPAQVRNPWSDGRTPRAHLAEAVRHYPAAEASAPRAAVRDTYGGRTSSARGSRTPAALLHRMM
jgi:hypothetical protein